MSTLRCAVVGTGYLGKFHAEKYAALPGCTLVACVDIDRDRAEAVAGPLGAATFADHRELLGRVDAVSIVAPTTVHHAIARDLLDAGVHVLLEKPMTVTVEEADDLIALARERGCILQVGHLERFNPALMGLDLERGRPLFIESHRLAPFKPRGNDVSVVLDLMIHDIDIILSLVDAPVERLDASGVPVLTADIDIANARLNFVGGCVANVTASRVSTKVERRMRLFMHHEYVSVDFQQRVLTRYRKGEQEMFPGIPEIVGEQSVYESGDALKTEIEHFLDCVRHGRQPLVPGEAGRRALEVAIAIGEQLQRSNLTCA